ncbi:MAG: RNA polymerase sigma factor [Tepidisphaeraceae bacterium]
MTVRLASSIAVLDAVDETDDGDLCRAALAGDRDAFGRLMARHQPRAMRFALRHLRGRLHDAEEVVQDAFLRAYANLAKFDPAKRFTSWLLTIVYRLCIDRGRRASLRIARELTDAVPAAPVERNDDAGQTWAIARQVLPADSFTALWMTFVEDMSIAEVAEAIGKTGIATKVMLHRAKRKLRGALKDGSEQ